MAYSKRKYFILYLIPVVLSIIIAFFIIKELKNSYSAEIISAKLRNSGVAVILAARFGSALREIDFIMRDISGHVSVDQLAFSNGENGLEITVLNQLLLRKIQTHSWLTGLGVLNRNGIYVGAVNRTSPQEIGADFSFREYFSYLDNNRDANSYFSSVFNETKTDDLWLACSRTLHLKPGQFDGVIFAGLSGHYIGENLLASIKFTEGGSIALIDASKSLVFRNPEIRGIVGKKVPDPNLDIFLSNNSESMTLIGFSPLDNQKKIIVFQKVDDFPYIFMVASNFGSDLANWYNKEIIYLCGWFFITIILFLLTNALYRLSLSNKSIEDKNIKLQNSLEEIKVLEGIVPICANCKKIRDDKGYWNRIEAYIEKHSDASFSHGMCPGCSDKLYGDQDWYIEMKKKKEIV